MIISISLSYKLAQALTTVVFVNASDSYLPPLVFFTTTRNDVQSTHMDIAHTFPLQHTHTRH